MKSRLRTTALAIAKLTAIGVAVTATASIVMWAQEQANPKDQPRQQPVYFSGSKSRAAPLVFDDTQPGTSEKTFMFSSKSFVPPRGERAFLPSSKSVVIMARPTDELMEPPVETFMHSPEFAAVRIEKSTEKPTRAQTPQPTLASKEQ